MNLKHQIRTDNLHHAYVLIGDHRVIFDELVHLCESELGFTTKGNPDFYYEHIEAFGIDDGRFLKDQAMRAPLGERKIRVTSFMTITSEAQNSLLKVLEEPTPNTHFFFIMPSEHVLLPTLCSRVVLIHHPSRSQAQEGDSSEEASAFLKAPIAERLEIAKTLAEEKDKNRVINLLNTLEYTIHAKTDLMKGHHEAAHALDCIMRMRSYVYDRSSSLKMILEYLAIELPQVK